MHRPEKAIADSYKHPLSVKTFKTIVPHVHIDNGHLFCSSSLPLPGRVTVTGLVGFRVSRPAADHAQVFCMAIVRRSL